MNLLLSFLPVFIGVFLQISPSTTELESTNGTTTMMSSMGSSSRNTGTSPGTDTVMTTQNSSTVATTVNGSESLTSTHSPSNATATSYAANGTTTESNNLTTHGETTQTSAHLSTSYSTESKTSMAINATTHMLTSETVTGSHMTSAFNSSLPITKPTETSDYLSTGTVHISTTSNDARSISRFDVASFLGGIVLALGLCVIVVFGYRCYKNRKSTAPPYRVVDE